MMKSSKLTEQDVVHVAKLARLSLTPQEIKKFQWQLAETLEYIATLNKVPTKGFSPTSQVTGLENVSREDEISQSKKTFQGLFKTKAVF